MKIDQRRHRQRLRCVFASAIPSSPPAQRQGPQSVHSACEHDGPGERRQLVFGAWHGRQAAEGQRQVIRDNAKSRRSNRYSHALTFAEKPVPVALLLMRWHVWLGSFAIKGGAIYWCERSQLTEFRTYDLIPVTHVRDCVMIKDA